MINPSCFQTSRNYRWPAYWHPFKSLLLHSTVLHDFSPEDPSRVAVPPPNGKPSKRSASALCTLCLQVHNMFKLGFRCSIFSHVLTNSFEIPPATVSSLMASFHIVSRPFMSSLLYSETKVGKGHAVTTH